MSERTDILQVDGMDCDGCERSINGALASLSGVKEIAASHAAGTVTVRYDDSEVSTEAIGKAIEDAGYEVKGTPPTSP